MAMTQNPSGRTVYRHYKGGRYEVVTLAVQSETHEPMVVYRSLDTAQVWVRPSDMFFGVVTVDGNEVRRFQRETSASAGLAHSNEDRTA
jgi:hypothetical protein